MTAPLPLPPEPISDERLGIATEFSISFEQPQGFERFACWLNGWLPFGVRLGRANGRRRFFRP